MVMIAISTQRGLVLNFTFDHDNDTTGVSERFCPVNESPRVTSTGGFELLEGPIASRTALNANLRRDLETIESVLAPDP
jgi:hypothetical protein